MGIRLKPMLKQINGEYLLLFAVIVVIMFLIYSSTGVTQVAAPEEITLSTMYPSPSGIYERVFARQLVDWDEAQLWDGTQLRVDPYGQSYLKNVYLTGNLILAGKLFGYDGGSFSPEYISLTADGATHRAVLIATSGRYRLPWGPNPRRRTAAAIRRIPVWCGRGN